MGQKVRPTGFRVGIMTDWLSTWYASKQDFCRTAGRGPEDPQVRQEALRATPASPKIRIERTREKVVVYIYAARVGMIIGKKGQEIDKLTKELEDLSHRHIEVKTMEVNRPEIDAQLVAEDIAEQLEKRASFRRTMKRAIDTTMENGAKGVTHSAVRPAGRLGNGPQREGDGRQHPALDAAGAGRVRLRRGHDRPGQHRHQGVDQQRRLSDPRTDPALLPPGQRQCAAADRG